MNSEDDLDPAPIIALPVMLHLNNAHDAYKIEWETPGVFLLTTHSKASMCFLRKVRGKIERNRSTVV